jgi:hypothetical protein
MRNVRFGLIALMVILLLAIVLSRRTQGTVVPAKSAPSKAGADVVGAELPSMLDRNLLEQGSKESNPITTQADLEAQLTTTSAPLKPEAAPKPKKAILVDRFGNPVGNATVLLLSYEVTHDFQFKLRNVERRRTDATGLVEYQKTHQLRLYAYKPGVGAHHWGGMFILDHENEKNIELYETPTLKVLCTRGDRPLAEVALSLTPEVFVASRHQVGYDREIAYAEFPPWNGTTDEHGRCAIEGLPNHGWHSDGRMRYPGVKFTIKAAWKGQMLERKIDGFPESEVRFIFD